MNKSVFDFKLKAKFSWINNDALGSEYCFISKAALRSKLPP